LKAVDSTICEKYPVASLRKCNAAQRGFTLVELAIVMFIIALLLGGMLLPLSAQQDVRSFGDTQKTVSSLREALLGFAMANDRLPCPASGSSFGLEVFCTAASGACTDTTAVQSHGRCAYSYNGFFPAATLGFSPVDTSGFVLDEWGSDTNNRVRYAVTKSNSYAFTTPSGMQTIGMTTLAPDLQVCNTGTGLSTATPDTAACATNAALSSDAVAVIYSLGKNSGIAGTGTHEQHNPNPITTVVADRAFVNAPQSTDFDDQIIWLSKSRLFNRMVTAGRLP
jgi:prepilin-type N-terminal cleavage/methylation domain-containing protein